MYKFVIGFVALVCVLTVSAFAQNKVVFDNQSGEPALVKLIGPTTKEVEVPNGNKAGVDAAAGRYTIKVRYGTPDKYHYTKGQEFEVKETGTTRSVLTITLHKVDAGNYESTSISESEFGAASVGSATKLPDTSAVPKPPTPEGSGSPPAAKTAKERLAKMDDDSFAKLTAALWLASDTKSDRANIIFQMAAFKVSDNELSQTVLRTYGITAEQFEQEYQRRMFPPEAKMNESLMTKVEAEMAKAAEQQKVKAKK